MDADSNPGMVKWRTMAEDARKLGINMRDPLSRQRMFELAATYDRIANSMVDEATAVTPPLAD